MKKTKSPYPDWVIKHRKPGTEVRLMRGKFYIYEVSSVYDKEKKRARKITGKYLGKITEEEGFVASNFVKVPKSLPLINENKITTREYGMGAFLEHYCSDIIDILKIHFPEQWEWLVACLYGRLVHSSPIKNIGYYFKRSYLRESINITLNPKNVSQLLRDVGKNRTPLQNYMKSFLGSSVALIDATSIVSYSKNLERNHVSKTKNGTYEPLFNLLYFYQPGTFTPAYYRLFDGNIKDIKMIQMAVEESGYKDALVIADKGFCSDENLEILDHSNLKFITPLKRNSTFIKKELISDLPKGEQMFLFAGRIIYYTSYGCPDPKVKKKSSKKSERPLRRIHIFVDEEAMIKEKKDFVHRMNKHPQTYTKEKFQEKLNEFGTFVAITNLEEDAEVIYQYYKSRIGIEVLFDGVKNILGNDSTYMQNNDALEGWMFINHLTLQIHHKIYQLLTTYNMISKTSVRDFIEYLSDIRIVKVNNKWIMETMPKDQQNLLSKLNLSIT
ncbi:MAG TPA: transposase [Arachidicoccus soli]|nr:transposase [Arachidicoccus soli]